MEINLRNLWCLVSAFIMAFLVLRRSSIMQIAFFHRNRARLLLKISP